MLQAILSTYRVCLPSSVLIHRNRASIWLVLTTAQVSCVLLGEVLGRDHRQPALRVTQLACLTADLTDPQRLRPQHCATTRSRAAALAFRQSLVPSFTLYLCRVPGERFARGQVISRGRSCWFNQLGGKTESSRSPCLPGKMILGRTSIFPVLRAKAAVRRF